MGTGSLN